MLTELLSDFYIILQPSYQSDAFQPYLSMMLTIMTITTLAFGVQTITTNIHTYATQPFSYQNNLLQKGNCKNIGEGFLEYLCGGLINETINQNSESISFEQDLQSEIK
jgi:hypothetical protein